ncbi:MAG TPA: hypothetical protein DCL41_11235 [Bdellovibrionales bacterium]|nr:hypothetical protein [Pseudobdellovibrionaceae bacterium]HAG92440.1 hypothetical protein [Bdellovibrionales bacterium]|tara:strand:- start:1208 stop:3115 length:1908 start_codon:yes stop_codon:yes gene_type:complete
MDKFSLFDQFLDAVFVVDETTQIAYVNQAASDLCGLSPKRLVGKKCFSELFEIGDFPFPMNADSLGYSDPSPYLETSLKAVSDRGKSARVQMSVSPWTGGGEKLWFFVFRDVSLEEALHGKYKSELEQKEGYIKELEAARIELEKYSKNLEDLVAERTKQLSVANRSLQAIINSLGQGFLTFDQNLECGDLYTNACRDLLEVDPTGKPIQEVLKVSEEKKAEFELWIQTLFAEPLPFEDLKNLGPDWFESSNEKSIYLEYFPIREENGKLSDVVVVATDKTGEVAAQNELDAEKSLVEMILKFVKGRSLFVRFLRSIPQLLDKVSVLSADAKKNEAELFRHLHTLEGEAGTFSLHKIRASSRKSQQWLQERKFEEFIGSLEELRESYKNSIQSIESFFGPVMESQDLVELSYQEIDALAEEVLSSTKNRDLSLKIKSLKSQQKIESVFSHYDGLIQGAAEKLGKKVGAIQIEGGDQKIEISQYQDFISSFVHVFRNIVDHGIEESDERLMLGKPAEGRIQMTFKVSQDQLSIVVMDDGRGMDPQAIRKKLEEKFPNEDFSTYSENEILQQIFRSQFSSRDKVSEFSGRGVGMDAVREEVAKLGGKVRVLSELGRGTRFEFEVPLKATQGELKRSA